MSNFQHGTLEDFDITADELGKIKEALKKKEFRDLFKTYIEEINDPENRKLYEKEITELERERGYEVKFIHPLIGYVIKTSSDGTTKTYINVCSNPNIDPPASEKTSKNGCGGLNWSVPYLLTPLKKIYGRNKNIFHVYDAIFHPDSLHLASKNDPFRELVSNTAIEGIETNFKIQLDKKNLKFLNVKYKGAIQPTVIRKRLSDAAPNFLEDEGKDGSSKLKFGEQTVFQSASNESRKQVQNGTSLDCVSNNSDYALPKYNLKYRSCVDFQDFTCDSVSKINAATPKEIVVVISLPLLKSTSNANLDISGEKLALVCETPAKYKLEINLPYRVYENKGSAVFDKSTRTLTVTLPVVKVEENLAKAFEYLREDSGVESDRTSGTSSIEDESAFHSDEKKIIAEDDSPVFVNECIELECDISEPSPNCDKDLYYSLPKFTTNYTKSTLAFTLHIKNIDIASVSKKLLSNNTAALFRFHSIGSGHFPVYYSFFVDILQPLEPSSVNVDVWDNSVIVQLSLSSEAQKNTTHYYVGLNENDPKLLKLELPHPATVAKNYSEEKVDAASDRSHRVSVTKHEADEVSVKLSPINESETSSADPSCKSVNLADSDDELEKETLLPLQEQNSKTNQKSSRKKKRRCNSVNFEFGTETSDIPSSIDSYNFSNSGLDKQRRGILKYSRSLSESEPADFSLYSSDYSCSLHDCTDLCSHDDNPKSHDKRVRFSDVVSSKTFRSNVSILSQNKRKQKKQKYKKRAQERRASESETEGEIDPKSGDSHAVRNDCSISHHEFEIPANVNHELDEGNASVSETSGDTSDGSEYNDNQASSKPPQKNSKARSRKNWQKTRGASAKLKVLNDLIFQLDDV